MNLALLNNGLQMPLVGLGTWKSKPGEVLAAVYEAIKIGYRHIDAAWVYENQDEVGEGICKAINDGIVRREDLWITSKLWNNFHSKHMVETHLRETLSQLKLDYLDLYLIHWPVTDIESDLLTPSIQETWLALEEMQRKGLTKTIGVSNFSVAKLTAMKEYATIWPAVNQVEMHPMLRQDDLIEKCKAMGTHVTAYSPLGSPDSMAFINHNGSSLLSHPVVQKLANENGKTAGQILIRWAIQHGSSVIPKSVTPSRIAENFAVHEWSLTPSQFLELSSLSPQTRFLGGDIFVRAGGPYRTCAELWDE